MPLSRRALLRSGLGLGAMALGAAPLLAAQTDPLAVLASASDRLFAPGARPSPRPSELGAAAAAAAYIDALPRLQRLQVHGLLSAIEWEPAARFGARFTHLRPEAQDAFLASLATSDHYPRRLMFHGLKQICAMGFYQHRLAWSLLGYDGPTVRP